MGGERERKKETIATTTLVSWIGMNEGRRFILIIVANSNVNLKCLYGAGLWPGLAIVGIHLRVDNDFIIIYALSYNRRVQTRVGLKILLCLYFLLYHLLLL